MKTVAIPLSKGKVLLWFLVNGLFVAGGIWLWGKAPTYDGLTQARALFVAITCIVFFGAGVVVLGAKLFDQRPGLVLNEGGVHRLGMFRFQPVIPWNHITHCSIAKVKSTRILLIHVDNVEEVLMRMPPITRWMQRLVLSRYGTPYSLTSNTLQCDMEQLKEMIENGAEAYRRSS